MPFSRRALCVLFSLLIIVSVFLPFYTASVLGVSASAALTDGSEGMFLIALGAVGLIASAFEKYLIASMAGIFSFAIFVMQIRNPVTELGELKRFAGGLIHSGAGYYLLLVGSLLLTVFAAAGLFGGGKRRG